MHEQSLSNPFDIPELDFGPAFFQEPQRTAAALIRDGARAAFVPRMGTVMLLRHGEVHAALTDKRVGAMGAVYYAQQGWTDGPYIDWVRRTVVFLDPPDHGICLGCVNDSGLARLVANHQVGVVVHEGRNALDL